MNPISFDPIKESIENRTILNWICSCLSWVQDQDIMNKRVVVAVGSDTWMLYPTEAETRARGEFVKNKLLEKTKSLKSKL